MKKALLLPVFYCLLFSANAQESNAAKFAAAMTPEDAKKHLSILASDDFEGRETGTAGAEKAANYLAEEFKKLGLQAPVNGSYFLPVPLTENKLEISFTINGNSPDQSKSYYIPEMTTNRDINTEEVVFIGYGTDSELGTVNLRGKVLLWIDEDPPGYDGRAYTGFAQSPDRAARLQSLLGRSPALILAVNSELTTILKKYGDALVDDPMVIKTKTPQRFSKDPLVVYITNTLADAVLDPSKKTWSQVQRAAAGKGDIVKTIPASVHMKYTVNARDVTANEVLGYVPGSDRKDELVIFSAHYDHIGLTGKEGDKVNNGADDDGSGTTALLEIARAFAAAKQAGISPRRSVLFLANVGEEKGLLGSQYYTDNPVFPLKNTIADLNMDMIGRVGPDYTGVRDSANYVYLIGPNIMSKDLKEISEAVNLKNDQLILDYKYDDANEPERIFFRSDHYNFAKKGIPIIFYTNGEHADYHKPSDEVGKINFPLLVKRARLAFYTGWELANSDTRPKAEKIREDKKGR